MISNSENTASSKQIPPKQKRFWLKLVIAIPIILVIVWLIPYLFANLLFNTAIKRAFSEGTEKNYSLEFTDIQINIFTREIIFLESEINQSKKADTLNLPKVKFQSDTLIFRNIDFQALRTNQSLEFEDIHINQFKLKIVERNNQTNKKNLNLPLSTFLSKLRVSNISVEKAEISYKQNSDSIYIPHLNFQIKGFHIDSLKDTVKKNRFHFDDFSLILKNQQIQVPDKSHLLSWEYLKLSTIEKCIELDNFIIKPNKSQAKQTSYSARIPRFRLDNFELDSFISDKQLLAQNLVLNINYLNIRLKNDLQKSKKINFKKQLNTFFHSNFNKIAIDTSQISIVECEVNLRNNQKLNFSGKSNLYLDHFQFDPKGKTKFSLFDGSLSLNKVSFSNTINRQKIQFIKGDVNYKNKNLNLFGLDFVSDSSAKIGLQLSKIELDNIDWITFLNADKLLAEKLHLKGGDFIQQYASNSKLSFNNLEKLDSLVFSFLHRVKIKTIQFENWNYSFASKAINAKDINLEINNFQVPSDSSLAFGSFSDFNTQVRRFSWVSTDQRHHYLVNNIESNSQTQNINIQRIQSFPRWKTLKNEPLEEKARFKIFAENIKLKTTKPFCQIIPYDTLSLSNLSIDSLSLKQFGKNINEKKIRSGIPPIHISSFELRQGDFAAYNDSSILSRLAQINGIHLQGDSLEIYSDSLFSINYKHLQAITKNGFYQNKAQGVSFNFQKMDFDSKDEALGIHQVNAELSSEKNGKSTLHKLNSKLVQINGFDQNLFLQRNLISVKEFKINAPTLISKSLSQNKQQANFRNLFSAENLQKLPYLEFNRFIIRDLTWLATYTVKGITNITTLEKANFEALDFRLSNRSFTNPERLFFSKSINFHIENFKQHLRNGNYLLMVADVNFSSLQKKMDFTKIQFYTLQKPERNNYNFTIDLVSFNGINFADFQRNYSLSVENILISKPKTNLHLYGFEESSGVKNLNTLELYPSLEPYFSQITLNRINILDMNLKLEIPKGNSTNTYNLGHLNLQMHNFKLDSTSKAFRNNRFLYTKDIRVHLRDYSAQIEENLYHVNFKDLRLSTLDGIIEIDSFQLKPQYNYAAFAKRARYQTDRFDIEINKVKLSGIDFQDAIFRQKYTVHKVEINHLRGEAFRDGLYPRLPDYQPLNPLQQLLALPYFIQVDSLYLNDAFFTYKEQGRHTQEPGIIFFDQLNVQILNLTNNSDFIKYGGNTVINAQALLMGKSELSLGLHFPLLDQGKSFKLNASLAQIEMDDLEPILLPLALIQARSGTIKSVELSIEANDDYAFGNMLMLYNNMKVDILKKSMKKGFFSSLFANALIKTENTNQLFPRKGPIYFERNKERSLFNYWAGISILGMKTSMGLADRRTAKKVKKLQKK